MSMPKANIHYGFSGSASYVLKDIFIIADAFEATKSRIMHNQGMAYTILKQ
jgi:hypothetical protein